MIICTSGALTYSGVQMKKKHFFSSGIFLCAAAWGLVGTRARHAPRAARHATRDTRHAAQTLVPPLFFFVLETF